MEHYCLKSLLERFARGATAAHSRSLHIEDDVLLVDLTAVLSLRLGPRIFLLRADAQEAVGTFVSPTEHAVREAGMVLLDERTLLATPVALQRLGLRISEWDLWGDDIDEAFARLREIAVG